MTDQRSAPSATLASPSEETFAAACPNCGKKYELPIDWQNTTCEHCRGVQLRPPRAPGQAFSPPVEEGDWPEDFDHENGQYMNVCRTCDGVFRGHKRRVTCKRCATPTLPRAKDPETDFAAALRIIHLIVTTPAGREHTSVPSSDLRALARVITAQQEHIVELETPTLKRPSSEDLIGPRTKGGDGLFSALWWALDLLDQYDERLAAIDGAARVYSPVHLEGKAKARRALVRALDATKGSTTAEPEPIHEPEGQPDYVVAARAQYDRANLERDAAADALNEANQRWMKTW